MNTPLPPSESSAVYDATAPRKPYSDDSLRNYADRVVGGWEVAHNPKGRSDFDQRIDTVRDALDKLYVALDSRPTPTYAPDQALDPLLELRENPRLLHSVLNEIFSIRKKLSRLPRVTRRREGDEARVITMGDAYLQASGSTWDPQAIAIFLNQAQRYDALELNELWTFPSVLKFLLLEEVIAQADGIIRDPGSHTPAGAALLKARMKSLRDVGFADWPTMVEPLIVYDSILRQDPAGAYTLMDFESREVYRKRVAEIARCSDCSEFQVAEKAISLAQKAKDGQTGEDPRLHLRRSHVGYYLVDRGFHQLASNIGYRPRLIDWIRSSITRHADDFYIGGILVITAILIGVILLPFAPAYSFFAGLAWAFLLLFLPATQSAVDLMNNTVTAIFKPSLLPKLDFSKGIPEEYSTLVVVPALLLNPRQVQDLFEDLEVRYLANQDRNIHFGLLTDLPDSVTRPRQNDTDPLVELAIRLTNELNQRYASDGNGTFFLLHRHRVFNARQGVWMGWERKRGKLLDLNKLLKGEFDPFPVKVGDLKVLTRARYVITLDSDTQLPRDSAHRLVGTLAHPLNRAIIDPRLRIVTEGYGILQPRVGVSVHSASRSRLAAIYSGQTGFDIYTRAVSDSYQDLYGEGIFTGKGIYEIDTLHSVLNRRFPNNALLSHDLIEGSYARVGLATDIEVIDDYPSHYSAFTRRKHRWVRGDWQITQWLFSKVPDESGKYGPNPIATISRWKIFDNLRRSLVETFTFILLVAGWLGLPGGAIYWTFVTLFLLFAPTMVQLLFGLGRAYFTKAPGAMRDAISSFWQGAFIDLLNLVFLPHQTLLALDAIIRSLVRSFITGQRLLEWETAAQAEFEVDPKSKPKQPSGDTPQAQPQAVSKTHRSTPVDRYLKAASAVALIVAILVVTERPGSLPVALPILVLWGLAGALTLWLNQPPKRAHSHLSERSVVFLRQLALRTWRFFNQFGGESHNYMIPDNVEEENLFEAARVSPTNFGLLLNSRQAAYAFGYLTLPEFVELTEHSLRSYEALEKYRGHIYNWYSTRTLAPLPPKTISSVDSGNLAASFYTLRSGCRAMLHGPLLDRSLFRGIHDHWQLLSQSNSTSQAAVDLRAISPPEIDAAVDRWVEWAIAALAAPVLASPPIADKPVDVPPSGIAGASFSPAEERPWWLAETRRRIAALLALVRDFMPWLLPEFIPLRMLPQMQGIAPSADTVSVGNADAFAADVDARISRASASLAIDSAEVLLVEELRSALQPARKHIQALTAALRSLAAESKRYASEMDFSFLMDKARLLLSIGYEVEQEHLHQACYDLLSSEARIAAFIAIAKGDSPQQSWFKLGRTHTLAYGRAVLISWTGTAFEYLMPSLWMPSYPDTLISNTLSAVVAIQRAFARQRGIPWGISESGWAQKDEQGHYHYQAFGIPPIALKWDAVAGPVISPYSSCLALGIDPVASLRNLDHMAKRGWIGAFGFYEAADYQVSGSAPELVREWMAHHQGMSLLAILNLLQENVVQRWFLANANLQATQLLLHEKPIRESTLKAEFRAAQPRRHKAS